LGFDVIFLVECTVSIGTMNEEMSGLSKQLQGSFLKLQCMEDIAMIVPLVVEDSERVGEAWEEGFGGGLGSSFHDLRDRKTFVLSGDHFH
jgi:hypothetical protein